MTHPVVKQKKNNTTLYELIIFVMKINEKFPTKNKYLTKSLIILIFSLKTKMLFSKT